MMPIAFIDTETTGLHVDKQLWEVAIIRRDPFTPEANGMWSETRYEAFVPVDLSNADLFGLDVGKFYERHPTGRYLSGRVRAEEEQILWDAYSVAVEVARMTHGARFIGAAPSFDAEVLGDFLRKHGLLPTWHHRLIDTHDLLTGYLIGRNLTKPSDIFEMSKRDKEGLAGVPPLLEKNEHTAMGDAQHEADIWDAIMG